MTDLTEKLADILRRAKDDEGPPSTETGWLIKEAGKLLLGKVPNKVRTFVGYGAYREAAMEIANEVLGNRYVLSISNGMLDPKYLDVRRSFVWSVRISPVGAIGYPMEMTKWPSGDHKNLARALLIATLHSYACLEAEK